MKLGCDNRLVYAVLIFSDYQSIRILVYLLSRQKIVRRAFVSERIICSRNAQSLKYAFKRTDCLLFVTSSVRHRMKVMKFSLKIKWNNDITKSINREV